jgi:hypothetical protein
LERLIEEFDVRTDAGQILRLYVYQDIIDAGSHDDPHATLPGLKRIVTGNGDPVNLIDEETFDLVTRRCKAKRL